MLHTSPQVFGLFVFWVFFYHSFKNKFKGSETYCADGCTSTIE